MPTLFDPFTINTLTLRNRIIRSATWEGMCAEDGRPTPRLMDLYADLAKGGVGLIISGFAFVSAEGRQLPGKMGLHHDGFSVEMEALTRAVHDAGGAVAAQLVHAGGQANADAAGQQPVAPSALSVAQYPQKPNALTTGQVETIVSQFGRAAGRAKQWGFDAVQLHGAHGYLINQFLSPLTNQRTDRYGGSVENRCRFLHQVYGAVRDTVGDTFPVFIKLNADDHLEGGLRFDDACAAARALDAAGIDAIEISSGTPASGDLGPARGNIDAAQKEAYNLQLARNIKTIVRCPVIAVGGFRSYAVANAAIERIGVDAVALSRPLIREPDLPNRWHNGERHPAACISCNKCFIPGHRRGGIYCVVERKESKNRL